MFTGLTAGAAVLPDIDHPNSTLAHCFGFLTKSFAWLIGKVSGGHRHLTHAILGVAGFEFLAWLAVKFRHEIGGKVGVVVLLFSEQHYRLLPRPLAFTTGTRPELWVLDPVLATGLGLLFYRAVQLGVLRFKFH